MASNTESLEMCAFDRSELLAKFEKFLKNNKKQTVKKTDTANVESLALQKTAECSRRSLESKNSPCKAQQDAIASQLLKDIANLDLVRERREKQYTDDIEGIDNQRYCQPDARVEHPDLRRRDNNRSGRDLLVPKSMKQIPRGSLSGPAFVVHRE
jgi:hypothetical protein